MRLIHKATVDLKSLQELRLPDDCTILSVQLQGANICLWYSFEEGRSMRNRLIEIVGTGHAEPLGKYLASVQQDKYVWHIYDNGWV